MVAVYCHARGAERGGMGAPRVSKGRNPKVFSHSLA